MKNFAQKIMYTDPSIHYIIDEDVYEYDIRSAGYNICKELKLIPNIEELEKYDKKTRQIILGKLQLKDPDLTQRLKSGFEFFRYLFYKHNRLSEDDVLSVKKDAIFVIGKRCYNLKFGNVKFILRNVYNSYININKLEFYFNNDVTVKGINDSLIPLHKDYMIDIILEFLTLLKSHSKNYTLEFIKTAASAYRTLKLQIDYYRELNNQSLFRLKDSPHILNASLGLSQYNLEPKDLDISYNYTHYLIPMFKMIL